MNALLVTAFLAARTLTLQDAVTTAERNQPSIRQSQADVDVAKARADETRAGLLPQITANGQFSRQSQNSLNFIQHQPVSWAMYDSAGLSATGTQVLFDAGLFARWREANASALASVSSNSAQLNSVRTAVRVAFFNARARKALSKVAADALANQQRHLAQVEGFVKAGARPEIDLAQARGDTATAKLNSIRAESDYGTARAQLVQSMGISADTDFDVADDTLPPIDGEDDSIDALMAAALKTRPDLIAANEVVHADELAVKASYGGFLPTVSLSGRASSNGDERAKGGIGYQVPNIRYDLTASWPIFSGLLTTSQVREARASLRFAEAQRDAIVQQVRFEVEQAMLVVRTAKAAQEAAADALQNTEERLRLAEGRYQAGSGSIIELGDAQLARDQAAAQRIQADYDLATARAQLLQALGRG